MNWSEFSLVVKPSPLGGIGVFATHDIPKGTILFQGRKHKLRRFTTQSLPAEFLKYCVYISDQECLGPERFDRMEIGWFINHSNQPNIARKIEDKGHLPTYEVKSEFYVIRDLKAGDEILIDYNYLDEPEHLKEEYYKNN